MNRKIRSLYSPGWLSRQRLGNTVIGNGLLDRLKTHTARLVLY